MRLSLKEITFIGGFFLLYLFSGLIHISHLIPYRPNLVSILTIPLMLVYLPKIKIQKVVLGYCALALVVGISALFNLASLTLPQVILFLRTLFFSFAMYFLSRVYLDENSIIKVIRWCLIIAMLQLPVVIFQQAVYFRLPESLTTGSSFADFDFGTFPFKADASMSFFLILNNIFLLFDSRNKIIDKKFHFPITLWLTFTVIFAHSNMSKILLISIWLVYIVFRPSLKNVVSILAGAILIAGILQLTNNLMPTLDGFQMSFSTNTRLKDVDNYLAGEAYRGGAISYYLENDLLLIGEGPGRFYDPITRTLIRGNVGHIFTFYSEVGALGLLISFLIFYFIAKEHVKRLSIAAWLYLFAMLAMGLTVDVMNDASVFFAYCIFTSTNLIPLRKRAMRLNIALNGKDSLLKPS